MGLFGFDEDGNRHVFDLAIPSATNLNENAHIKS